MRKTMKPFIVLYIFTCFCLGCDGVQKPNEVNVQVDTVHPIAKLVKSIPSTRKIVSTGDTIFLEFTEVPENLTLSAFNLQQPLCWHHFNPSPRFHISQFEYNADTQARFVIAAENVQSEQLGFMCQVRVIVQWTHGYKELDFDVKLS